MYEILVTIEDKTAWIPCTESMACMWAKQGKPVRWTGWMVS